MVYLPRGADQGKCPDPCILIKILLIISLNRSFRLQFFTDTHINNNLFYGFPTRVSKMLFYLRSSTMAKSLKSKALMPINGYFRSKQLFCLIFEGIQR
jgi:hypothetical protein